MKCPYCEKDRLSLAPMITSEGVYQSICPVCALFIKNDIHGLPQSTPFSGLIARQMYDDEIEHEKVAKEKG